MDLAHIRAAAAGARTPADVDRLLDQVHAYADAHPAHAEASADVAESLFAARHALERVTLRRPRAR